MDFKKHKAKPFYIFCSVLTFFSFIFSCVFANLPTADKNIMTANANNDYIKWVDFKMTEQALSDSIKYDIKTHNTKNHTSFIDLLAYLACKNGGNFKNYKNSDLAKVTDELKKGTSIYDLAKQYKVFSYYKEAYSGVLSGFVGEFDIETEDENGNIQIQKKYGLKAFSPIARGYYYSHSDDFGNARSYGFKRKHLGHDMFGSVGTPIVAVESGVVECVGWNRYGGWRIGIRSFDKKRYYYYAHLRKDHPYNDMYEGKIVTAGEVIGYLGMTGYSTKENVNNINTPHLHFGMQLIFDESQKDAVAEIWIDVYAIVKLLEQNKSQVIKREGEKDFERKFQMFEPEIEVFKNSN